MDLFRLAQGIPIRIEIGPRDMAAKQIVAVRRDTGEKTILAFDGLATTITELLSNIHSSMFAKYDIRSTALPYVAGRL